MNYTTDLNWTPTDPAWMLLDNGELEKLSLQHTLEVIDPKDLDLRFREFCSKVKYGGKLEITGHELSELCYWYSQNQEIDNYKQVLCSGRKNYIDKINLLKMLQQYGFKTNVLRLPTNVTYYIEAERLMQ